MTDNLRYNQVSSTVGGCFIAASLFAATLNSSICPSVEEELVGNRYVYQGNASTFDCYRSKLEGVDSFLEHAVINFYTHLLADQEPPGIDFEKVLYENLWDLYES